MNVKRIVIESIVLGILLYLLFGLSITMVVVLASIIVFIELFFSIKDEPSMNVRQLLRCPCCDTSFSRVSVIVNILKGIKEDSYVLYCPFCHKPIALYRLYVKKVVIVGSFALVLILMMFGCFQMYVGMGISLITIVGMMIYFLSHPPMVCDAKNESKTEDEFKKEKRLLILLTVLLILFFVYVWGLKLLLG